LADSLGYATVKIVEHYFRAYRGYSPSPLIFLAAAAQRTRHIRLVTGAVIPAFHHPLKLAAELAYGLMFVPYLSDFADLAQKIALHRRTYRATTNGREPPPPSMALHLYMAASTAQARREAKPYIEQYMAIFQDSAVAWTGRQSSQYRGYELLQQRLQALTYDRVLAEGRALIGESHAVLDQLHHLRPQFGPIQPEMQIMFGNMDYTQARRSVELFGQEVLPAVEGL
jgi:alkanesulfonate monooxygenase SsuD/methylene tetrahydromethanopterin reductase-like flavin-dependent oxidoreductase (luciferase family)